MSEGKIWREIRDKLSNGPLRLFRNEVGNGVAIRHKSPHVRQSIIAECIALAARLGGSAGRIHFGLAVGSGDLIGHESITVTPEMVGKKVAVFTSVETKTATGSVREEQLTWQRSVNNSGGIAIIARSKEDAENKLREGVDKLLQGVPQSAHAQIRRPSNPMAPTLADGGAGYGVLVDPLYEEQEMSNGNTPSLAEVIALSELAAKGPWHHYAYDEESFLIRDSDGNDVFWPSADIAAMEAKDAAFVIALVNWFRTSAASLRDEGWLPIDSAPDVKGDCFWCRIAWGPEDDQSTGDGFRWDGKWFAAGCFYQLGQDRKYAWREIEVQPTHWMPKSQTPPATQPAAQERQA